MVSSNDWKLIDSWLKKQYPTGPVPSFERNEESFQALCELKKHNEAMDIILSRAYAVQQHLGAMQNDMHQSQAHVLETLQVDKSMITTQGRRSLEVLTALAVNLGIKDNSLSSYQSSIARLTIKSMDTQIEKQELDNVLHIFDGSIQKAEQELSRMKEMLAETREQQKADQETIETLTKDTLRLKQGVIDEDSREDEYDAIQIEQRGLRLAEMRRFEDQLIQLELELSEKKRKLEFYHDLPADMESASLQFQEYLQKLDSLEQKRQQLLAKIAQSVR